MFFLDKNREGTVVENSNETILGHAQTRNQFLDNLNELEAFLLQRKDELTSDSKGKSTILDPLQVWNC